MLRKGSLLFFLRWFGLGAALLWLLAVLILVAVRWVDPPTTAVQIQRRLQGWIHNTLYHKRYKFVPLSQISPDLQHAVIAAEDARSYEHHGFDFPEAGYGDDASTTAHGVYLAIGTGRVTFVPLKASELSEAEAGPFGIRLPKKFRGLRQAAALRLEEIPPLVFSEVMRDCDLFVGVSSIGMDPAWSQDRPDDPHLPYWQHFAFGDLTTASENRKAVLENLLPKLAMRDRCRVDGRFLLVRGDRHEYRIHIGSANVLIEPGSRYLCIVQGPGDAAAHLPLPFEGDRILALILSKALLLVNDSKIKDPAITRQLS